MFHRFFKMGLRIHVVLVRRVWSRLGILIIFKVNPWLWLPMEARFLIKGANPDLQILENGRENLCGSNRKKVIQTWDSQYFRGETMVVVAKKNYALDQWGKPESRVDDKSLGLPVWSLKSRIKDTDSTESMSGSRSKSCSKTSSSKSSGNVINGKFGKLGPLKLEEQLKETVALPSPIPCRSRSGMMEMREEADSFHSHSHFMSPSFEEPEFKRLQSRSLRSSTSYSSQTSFVFFFLPRKLSPSSTASSELGNSKMEELGRRKSLYGSSTTTSPSPPRQMNGKAPLDMSRFHQFF